MARALVKDADVLLLDEATASLDRVSELTIQNALSGLTDKIVIAVTHNISEENLLRYDAILVMKYGKIMETGSYKELISTRSLLYEMSFHRMS